VRQHGPRQDRRLLETGQELVSIPAHRDLRPFCPETMQLSCRAAFIARSGPEGLI
jgi:hypothetical protein